MRKTKSIYRLAMGEDGPIGDFAPVVELHHVSHLGAAAAILKDGVIKARRVDDGGRLDDAASVCWLSPNQYGPRGSHHGTVQFTFDFAELVRGGRIYWVEGVAGRKQPTCRLLVARKGHRPRGLKRYDPVATEGPLRRVGKRWFRKWDVAVEIMIEGDLPLKASLRVEAVPHGVDRCGRGCGEVGRAESDTAARLLAGLMRGRYGLPGDTFVRKGLASPFLHAGWSGLLDALGLLEGDGPRGQLKGADRVDIAVRSALKRVARGDAEGAVGRIATVRGERRVRRSLRRLLQRVTGLELGSPYDVVIGLAPPTSTDPAAGRRSRRPRSGEARPSARNEASAKARADSSR